MAHPLGKIVPGIEKCALGFTLIVVIILLIGGPLILFSGLNPATVLNPPVAADLSFKLNFYDPYYDLGSTYPLFETDQLTKLEMATNEIYDEFDFSNNTILSLYKAN